MRGGGMGEQVGTKECLDSTCIGILVLVSQSLAVRSVASGRKFRVLTHRKYQKS